MKNFNKRFQAKQPKMVVLVNPVNNEVWCCDDYEKIKSIDGEDFIMVYKNENPNRTFFMKKSALKLLDKKQSLNV